MDALASSPQARLAVDRVLHSGIFEKAPRLEKFFLYICRLHFEGRAGQIKEYSIAIEALGRPADFDPKKDSIVRVEAHRLRKRLEEYYRGPGVGDPVHIVIPNGQYRPHFVLRRTGPQQPFEQVAPRPSTAVVTISEADPQSAIQLALHPEIREIQRDGAQFPWRPRLSWPLALVVLVAATTGGILLWWSGLHKRSLLAQLQDEKWSGPSSEPVGEEFRILTGYHGSSFIDSQGHTWGSDAYFSGGVSKPIPAGHLIEGQPDPHLLRTQRSGQFQYAIPLRQGSHELHLYFAETDYGQSNPLGGGEASRIFQISVNGEPALTMFDPLANAGGPNRLCERVLKDIVPASDGKLHLRFDPVVGPAFLNGLGIMRSLPGRIHPIRIVTQNSPVTDSEGRLWAADEYFCGGISVCRRNVVANSREKALYQGERYGNFSYRIPVAPGEYRLTLHFAETWFGTPESQLPALESRLFNVFANGVALLRDYQIAKDAGGPNRSVEKVFENLTPNAQGELLLQFVPVRNYAEVNAIEVVETK
jgi:Malectin domain